MERPTGANLDVERPTGASLHGARPTGANLYGERPTGANLYGERPTKESGSIARQGDACVSSQSGPALESARPASQDLQQEAQRDEHHRGGEPAATHAAQALRLRAFA